jgi:glycerol-3-phosphate dehydrogenase
LGARGPAGPFGGGLTVAPFSRETRQLRLAELDRQIFDIAVVGGGITGAGVARDAALRGYRVLLVEQGDFGSGTSSASSKLIHGGLRYLAHGQLGLVYEALTERRVLRRIAPHLVRPVDFLFPVYEGDPTGLIRLRMGISLYDLLSLVGSEKLHRSLKPQGVLELQGELRGEGLQGGLVYYDCQVDDARLTLENVIDAHDLGAVALSYLRVDRRETLATDQQRLRMTDSLSGRAFEARARVVINATGPWCEALAPSDARPLVRPTKGVHLVFSAARLPVRQAVVMQTGDDARITFAIPWGTHTYVGTTESEDVEDPGELRTTQADVQYLIRVLARYFPSLNLSAADVLCTWVGARPLIRSDESATDTSREHRLVEHEPGFLTVVGGKLTTYRHMAVGIVDRAGAHLKTLGIAGGESGTADRALPGGKNFPSSDRQAGEEDRLALETGLEADCAAHLLRTYGGRSREIAATIALDPAGTRRMVADLPYVEAEFRFALMHEMVVLPEDFLIRRTNLFHKAPDGGRRVLDQISGAFDSSLREPSAARYEAALRASRSAEI